jgi:hypothetical protein
MYNESWSWKLETKVVMKGCPATAARTFRSLRTCSTCLRRITGRILAINCALIVLCTIQTVRLAQDLKGKHLVLAFLLVAIEARKPYSCKCACPNLSACDYIV